MTSIKIPAWKMLFSWLSREDQTTKKAEKEDLYLQITRKKYAVTELNQTFYTLPQGEKDLWRARSFGSKEPETNAWIRSEINDSSVFWDIGANIGLFSLYAASLNENCKILAFEPESQNFSCLCQNVFINSFRNIDVLGFAINDSPASIDDLHVSEMAAGCAVHNLGSNSPWSLGQAVFHQKTFSISPDDLVKKFGFQSPSMMKIDVDGVELGILRGSRQILSDSLQTVLLEIDATDNNDVKEMTEIMQDAGFFLKDKSDRSMRINEKLPCNYIWKKR